MIRVTQMPVAVYVAAKKVDMPLDAYLRHEGLHSCEFKAPGGINSWWEMSDEDYTMFILRWGHDI